MLSDEDTFGETYKSCGKISEEEIENKLEAGKSNDILRFLQGQCNEVDDLSTRQLLDLLYLLVSVSGIMERVGQGNTQAATAVVRLTTKVGRALENPRHAWGTMGEAEENLIKKASALIRLQ